MVVAMHRHNSESPERSLCTAAVLVVAAVVLLWCDRSWSQSLFIAPVEQSGDRERAEKLWDDWEDPCVFWHRPPGPDYWTIDYRCRTFCDSNTSFEFGTAPGRVPSYSTASRLDFSLNSCWHGLQIASETPKSAFQFEWYMAGSPIGCGFAEYDWFLPGPAGSFTDLGFANERFTEGQMLDLSYRYKPFERVFGLPIEAWPTIGFRWQRLDITTYDTTQVKANDQWLNTPWTWPGDAMTFNQQYYTGYVGALFRGKIITRKLPPLAWTAQGDWGYTEGYNIADYVGQMGDPRTMDATHGDTWHVAVSLEALFTPRISAGFQADHLVIDTQGTHHLINVPANIDQTWGNGENVFSRQTWLTAFVRIRI
jgi:hypothetical protein